MNTRHILIGAFFLFSFAYSHEGHGDAAPSEEAGRPGPVTLSPEAKQNLELKTAEVIVQPIEKTIKCQGTIQPIAGTRGNIASKIVGRIAQIYVTLGQAVKPGDALISIEARQVSEAPVIVKLVAPRKGDVVKLNVIQGDAVEPGASLLEIADYSEVYAVAQVYETQIDRIKKNMAARVYLPGLTGNELVSIVDLIGSEVNPLTHTVDVWLRVKNMSRRLKINMAVAVYFIAEKESEALVVPRSAILTSGGEKFVFTEEGNRYERVPVVTGLENDKWIEIIEGLAPGDIVVTQGNYQLQFTKTKPAEASPKHAQ